MNCKPGDLAVFISSLHPANVGKLCLVKDRFRCEPGEWRIEALGYLDTNYGPAVPGELLWADDVNLRPIRDQPGDDESLTWAGKPEHVAPREPVTQG